MFFILSALAAPPDLSMLIVPPPADWDVEYIADESHWEVTSPGTVSETTTVVIQALPEDAPKEFDPLAEKLMTDATFLDQGFQWIGVKEKSFKNGLLFEGTQKAVWADETLPALLVVRELEGGIWITCHPTTLAEPKKHQKPILTLCKSLVMPKQK